MNLKIHNFPGEQIKAPDPPRVAGLPLLCYLWPSTKRYIKAPAVSALRNCISEYLHSKTKIRNIYFPKTGARPNALKEVNIIRHDPHPWGAKNIFTNIFFIAVILHYFPIRLSYNIYQTHIDRLLKEIGLALTSTN